MEKTGTRKRLLFFTNSEWGQANILLATIHEFLIREEHDIYLASFSPLQKRIFELFETHADAYPRKLHIATAVSENGERPSLTCLTVKGPSIAETCHRDGIKLPHKPGVQGAIKSYYNLAEMAVRYTGKEYIECCISCVKIIESVRPDLILSEQGFNPGIDAAQKLGRKFTILSPNSFKDFEQNLQPWLGVLWKYPALASAFPYPVPWRLIPTNIYLCIRMLVAVLGAAINKNSRLAKLDKVRHSFGYNGPVPIINAYLKSQYIICPSLPQLDFPMKVRAKTTGCGPIVLPAVPVSKLDPELSTWLNRRPTLLVNLGTHYSMDFPLALEVAKALKATLESFPHIQVLWKVMLESDQQDSLDELFGWHFKEERIRMESWLKPDPVALLETGQIIAQVHHGGGNTYFESCRYGVPHVVLAAWWDTYEYAARVEYLGIGVFGNKIAAPRAESKELTEALSTVLGSEKMRNKAQELAMLCQQREGRVVAHDRIVEILGESSWN